MVTLSIAIDLYVHREVTSTRKLQKEVTAEHEKLMERCDRLAKESDNLREQYLKFRAEFLPSIYQAAQAGWFCHARGLSTNELNATLRLAYKYFDQ